MYGKGKRGKNEEETKNHTWPLCARHGTVDFMDITSYNPTSATPHNRHDYPPFPAEGTEAQRGLITKVMQLASKPQN